MQIHHAYLQWWVNTWNMDNFDMVYAHLNEKSLISNIGIKTQESIINWNSYKKNWKGVKSSRTDIYHVQLMNEAFSIYKEFKSISWTLTSVLMQFLHSMNNTYFSISLSFCFFDSLSSSAFFNALAFFESFSCKSKVFNQLLKYVC